MTLKLNKIRVKKVEDTYSLRNIKKKKSLETQKRELDKSYINNRKNF